MVLSDDPETRRRQLAAIYAKGGFGGGYRSYSGGGYMSVQTPQDSQISANSTESPHVKTENNILPFFKSVGSGALKGAIVYGISAAVPPAGTVLIPLYHLYDYAQVGFYLYKTLDKITNANIEDVETKQALIKLSDSTVSTLPSTESGKIATYLTNSIQMSGLISQVATKTNLNEQIYTSMLRGSIDSAVSSGLGNFTGYTVGKLVGM